LSIFVSIASYRDSECQDTIEDLLNKSSKDNDISIGLFAQYFPEDDFDWKINDLDQVKVIYCDAKISRGAGWGKSVANMLYSGQDYFLVIDSHMRFVKNWDQTMIEMLKSTPSSKPIISSYPPEYTLPDLCEDYLVHMGAKKFGDNGILEFQGIRVDGKFEKDAPRRTPFVAGGFIFSLGQLFCECPFDPLIYFYGEEISFSARSFTHGWDSFSPNLRVINHYYDRSGCPKQWDDDATWFEKDSLSVQRVKDLFSGKDLGSYGFGMRRSLKEFEEFSGINFKDRIIQDFAIIGNFEKEATK